MRSSVPEFHDELHCFIAKIVDELRTAGYIRPDQDQITGTSMLCMTEGESVYHIADDLARSRLPAAPFSHFNAQLPSSSQFQAIPIDDSSTRLRAPCLFAKISNPIQKMFENFPVTDGLQTYSLISFLRVLVQIQYMAPVFGISTRPMEKLFIDFVGKLPRSKSGNAYALICVDAFTKFVWIFPVREASTATVIRALDFVFATFGIPEI
jgi:hypothetical protein